MLFLGVFEGFSDEAQETFILRSGNELKTFSSACLCVQSDAIKSCTLDSKIPHKTMGESIASRTNNYYYRFNVR